MSAVSFLQVVMLVHNICCLVQQGGGNPDIHNCIFSAGGGALLLRTRLVINEGTIEVNGAIGSTYIGGGSGGSIHISTQELEGSGTIEVVGGNGGSYAGGGGGGRIWISYESTRFWFGEFKAEGGSGYTIGGAGTVYLEVEAYFT